jgi:PAS domain S-box-containing protein
VNDEERRLDELQRYDVLDTEREAAFDRLAEVAALVCGAPIAFISFVDARRVWHKAEHGAAVGETGRERSLCAEALAAHPLLLVEDALAGRYADYGAVAGALAARFYAGAPLTTPRGLALGALCVLDRRPRPLAAEASRALLLIRDEVMRVLEDRRELFELRRAEAMRQEAVEALLATKADLQKRIELRTREVETTARRLAEAQAVAHVGSWEWAVAENRVTWSEEMHRIYGTSPERFDGSYEGFLGRVHPDDLAHTRAVVSDAYASPKRFTYDHRIVRSDGAVRMLHTAGEAIADASGRVQRMVGTCWDTTEQWEATRKLEHASALAAAVIAEVADAVLVLDEEERLIAINDHCARLFELGAGTAEAAPPLARVAAQLVDGASFLADVAAAAARGDHRFGGRLALAAGGSLEYRSSVFHHQGRAAGRVWTFSAASAHALS